MAGGYARLHICTERGIAGTKDENEAMRPAIDGVLRILKFARRSGIKRVVMTSSFGAVGFSHTDKKTFTTEADWTDPDLQGDIQRYA